MAAAGPSRPFVQKCWSCLEMTLSDFKYTLPCRHWICRECLKHIIPDEVWENECSNFTTCCPFCRKIYDIEISEEDFDNLLQGHICPRCSGEANSQHTLPCQHWICSSCHSNLTATSASFRCPKCNATFSYMAQLEDILEDQERLLQCPVCFRQAENSKLLHCNHLVCDLCLERLQKPECPICRASIVTTSDFPSISYIDQIKNTKNQQKKQEAICTTHRNKSDVYCVKCDKNVCEHCLQKHEGHTRVRIEYKSLTLLLWDMFFMILALLLMFTIYIVGVKTNSIEFMIAYISALCIWPGFSKSYKLLTWFGWDNLGIVSILTVGLFLSQFTNTDAILDGFWNDIYALYSIPVSCVIEMHRLVPIQYRDIVVISTALLVAYSREIQKGNLFSYFTDNSLIQGQGRQRNAEDTYHDLNDMLNCPLCSKRSEDPRFLPCQHWFCSGCLSEYIQQTGEGQMLKCPTCKTAVHVPTYGSSGFPAAFWIAQIQDIVCKYEPKLPSNCTHHRKTICIHCETCDLDLCTVCALDHDGHVKSILTGDHREVKPFLLSIIELITKNDFSGIGIIKLFWAVKVEVVNTAFSKYTSNCSHVYVNVCLISRMIYIHIQLYNANVHSSLF